MNNLKSVRLLKSFTRQEIQKLRRFVKSFYADDDSKVIKLLDAILEYYPAFSDINFTKKNLYKKIYGQKKYNDAAFRKLLSYLHTLSEEFLVFKSVRDDKFAAGLYLLTELSARNNDSLFRICYASMKKKIKDYPKNNFYYYYSYRFLNIINGYYVMKRRSIAVDNYREESDSFFLYFFVELLNIYIYLANEKKISNRDFELTLFNEIMPYLRQSRFIKDPSVFAYYNCAMLTVSDDEKYFIALRKLQMKGEASAEVERIIYIVLQSFCISQVKKGIVKFKQEAFELQKESITKRLHLSEGKIHIFTFLNIVSEAASRGETLWAERFINENRKFLEPEYEFDAVNLSYAKCEFSRGEFERALIRLSKINMESSHFKLSVKTLMLMIYYETEFYDSALSLLDSYKHFISRDKQLPKADKENRLEFTKYYKEILSLKMKIGTDTYNPAKEEISLPDNIIEKEWFLNKLDELNKKRRINPPL